MKRKIDRNKVYAFIGKAIIIILANVGMSAMLIYGIMHATTLN